MADASLKSPGLDALVNAPVETTEQTNMLFGVPKKGRLFDKISKLLEGCGLDYNRPNRVDIAQCKSLPITIVFLPAADIAAYVGEGNVDLGITGEDIVAESGSDVDVVLELGFGKCKLAVQAPVAANITDPKMLLGKRIVTSFPNAASKFFGALESNESAAGQTNIKYVSGSVEAACGLGLADGIVDLVETGTTMKAAGLEIVATIMETQSVLISNKHSPHAAMIEKVRQRIVGYITAEKYCMVSYNISRENLPKAVLVTPGKKAPTVTPLENEAWVAVGSLILKKEVQPKLDELQEAGAEDILIFPISNTRMG
eukprot:TRINITY_DN50571_c0_g1_i2.p1 TRINITY_DN50571_c0_g1~~TRINITY_DN50571_c0_g1_i2.p1  ORF type:complete len:314 (-),score=78.95 TRINITY_DN50571_c0_g1_i2:124-1065(-)